MDDVALFFFVDHILYSDGLSQSKHSAHPWVGVVMFSLTGHIQGVRLGWNKHPPHPWVGGVLLSVADHIQCYVGSGQTPS